MYNGIKKVSNLEFLSNLVNLLLVYCWKVFLIRFAKTDDVLTAVLVQCKKKRLPIYMYSAIDLPRTRDTVGFGD
jgi:hypothetical protein